LTGGSDRAHDRLAIRKLIAMISRSARRSVIVFGAAILLVFAAQRAIAEAGSTISSVAVGSAPSVPPDATSLGALPAQTLLTVTIVLSPPSPAELAAAAQAVSTPGSPAFHQYLSVGQFAARFGADPGAVANLRAALSADGLEMGSLAPDGLSFTATGDSAHVSRAFGVVEDRYRRPGSASVYANVTRPRLPTVLAGTVSEVLGLDDLPAAVPADLARGTRREPAHTASDPLASGPQPCAAATTFLHNLSGYTINQVADAYGMGGLYANGDLGAGETVALFELEPYSGSDLAAFQSCFGTSASVTNVEVDGGPGSTGPGSGETALDLDNVIGIAPASSVSVYQGPDTFDGSYDTFAAIVNQDTAQVVSYSWDLCEPLRNKTDLNAEDALFEQAALQGQSVFVASGDLGPEGCANDTNLAVDDPASQPFVTAVGGTHIDDLETPPLEETYDDDPGGGASGGGISQVWPMPSYQATLGVNSFSSGAPCGLGTAGYCREVPDVSASASEYSGYAIYHDSEWEEWGGTSAAAPVWAGLTALANASGIGTCSSATPLGFLNPDLYAVAAGPDHADAFNDVTVGDSAPTGPNSPSVPYQAGPGYDLATGLGTPLATDGPAPGLVAQLCASTGFTNAQVIDALHPSDAAPGTTVTIDGSGFTRASTVAFGSVAAINVHAISDTQLSATVPSGSGVVAVTVANPHGTSAVGPAATFTYAPTVTIATPAAGGVYTEGQAVTTAFSCAASAPGTSSCSGPVGDGGPLDTSSVGAHTFSVTAIDSNGVPTVQVIDYFVDAPPVATISAPQNGATYVSGRIATALYSCAAGAPGGATCTGPVGSGAQIDTAVGTHTFAVTATDSNGVSSTTTVTYSVIPSHPTISELHQSAPVWLERAHPGSPLPVGTAFSFTLDLPASVTLSFSRMVPGRSVDGRCKPLRVSDHAARPCTRSLPAGSITLPATVGLNTVRFQGRAGRGELAPGTYVVRVDAIIQSGPPSVIKLLHFVIATGRPGRLSR
jgi:hypothetical protein